MKPDRGSDHQNAPRRRARGGFRSNFLTGLVVVLPVGLTFWLIWKFVGWIDGWVLPFIPANWRPDALLTYYLGYEPPISVRGAGVLIFLFFTVFIGWVAKGLIGRSLIGMAEGFVDRMPFVRSVYNGLKQIAETVFSQSDTKFDRACLIEYPRKGIWAVGFVSTAAKGEVAEKIPEEGEILTVFLPTTPNPTSGFLLYVPASDVQLLERMSVEDAAKLVI
ncbi:MAG: DUF502 domain-containing protein, partial [Albidovulum sp.]|uniref:DUF502 domain-containing protein n=1 Tax=Albidovulum sp. TaxID=1872424 RepID=UPI003C8712DD